MRTADVNLSVVVSKSMIDNPSGIYKARYRVDYGKDGFAEKDTIYCHYHHDFGVSNILRVMGVKERRIKKVEITALKQHGASVSKMDEIKKWKITHEKEG